MCSFENEGINIMKKIQIFKALICLILLLACVAESDAIVPICPDFCEPYDDDNPVDPNEWIIVNPGRPPEITTDCHLRFYSDVEYSPTGLQRILGPGDFKMTVEWDNIVLSGDSDNQFHIRDTFDGSISYLIVQNLYQGGSLTLNVITINGPTGGLIVHGNVALGADTESLNVRIVWQDDTTPGLGGTWQVDYDKNDSGYLPLADIPSNLTFDASSDDELLNDLDRYMTFTWIPIRPGAYVAVDLDTVCIESLDKAYGPRPGDGAQDVDPDADLAWYSLAGTVNNDVYFGTDLSCVENGNSTDPQYLSCYKGRFAADNFELDQLELLTTYYWRIDNVDSVGAVTQGDVWSFKTAGNYYEDDCVEQFDSYADNTAMQAVWGFLDPNDIFAPDENITLTTAESRSGSQSMSIAVDNSAGSDDESLAATRLIVPGQDWTAYNSVSVWVKVVGDISDTTRVSLGLTGLLGEGLGSAVIVPSTVSDWVQVDVTLNRAVTGLSNIAAIGIGVSGVAPGDNLTVYCDDICLRYNCGADFNLSPADANGDCKTNLLDFAAFAQSWLDCSYLDGLLCD